MFRSIFIPGVVLIMMVLLGGCTSYRVQTNDQKNMDTKNRLSFLALGDSYTIGESVGESERWPVQLARMLRENNVNMGEPKIIAKTGWTTDELSAAIEQEDPQGPFDLVSLLIGVNNQYRGWNEEGYRLQFTVLLQRAIAFAGGKASHVIVLSIPDWGVTPFAEGRDRSAIGTQIDKFNAINALEAQLAGVQYVDVTPVSRKAPDDPTLVAGDGLHPSGKMYTEWTKLALPKARKVLE